MFASVDEFLAELTALREEFFPAAQIQAVYSRIDRISLRLVLDASLFVDIYFNGDNGRLDFSLIKEGDRIFGYDNLKPWHCHPFEDPDQHISCAQPFLRHIVQETKHVVNQLKNR
jgi:hypothetical protein